MRTTIRSTRRYCRTATMRSSAPSSRAMTMIPEAPPAIIEKAPVTGVIPRCSRSSRPAARLRARVVRVTSRTGSQFVATVRRVSRSTRAPMVTPMTACPAVVARGGTATPPRPPRARTSPAVRPPKRAGEGRPSAVNTRVTATAPATTRARSASCRRRREPTRSLCPEEPTHDRPGRADDGDGTCKGPVVTPSVSTSRRTELLLEPSGVAVSGGVVGDVVLPASVDDADPGAGEDAHRVRVVVAAGAGVGVDLGGPGAVVSAVVGEGRDGLAETLVAGPAEMHGVVLAGLVGDR